MIFRRRHILVLATALVFSACANVVAPTGGPKDSTPPKVVAVQPENQATGFTGNRIEITFDEYVTLNNASQQVLFSPPLANKPDIKLSNRTVTIKLKEELKANTTYTIDFGEAVKDLHEGNTFQNYTYTFSTGEVLDTLTLTGTVLDAVTKKPVDKLFVSLYRGDTIPNDSLFQRPCRQTPDYITRTDKEGRFLFHGLPDVPFLVFALEDMNSNRYYDLPNEQVAFIDTLVCPSDSAKLTLMAFTEVDTTQMVLENKLVEEGLLRFAFRQPADSVSIDLSWPEVDSFQMVQVWSANHDTLRCWFTPNVLDSLKVKIQYDTLFNIEKSFSLQFKETQQRRRRSDAKTLKVGSNLQGKLLLPGDDFLLQFPEPVTYINKEAASENGQSRFEPADPYGMTFRRHREPGKTIPTDGGGANPDTIAISDSVFFSVRGRTHDTLTFIIQPAQPSDLGNIFIKVSPPDASQVVVQLLDNKDHVLDQRVVDTTQRIGFTQLVPGKYKLQAIIDADRNGRWSPGNFHRRFLPEPVVPFKNDLDVKAAWDIDLDEAWEPR